MGLGRVCTDPSRGNRAWRLVGAWLSRYLDEHPGASPAELQAALGSLNPTSCPGTDCHEEFRLASTIARLGEPAREDYVVTVNYGHAGTFFIIGRESGGSHAILWDIKPIAAEHYPAGDEIGYWAHAGFGWGDGPLIGRVTALPDLDDGRARFMIDAYAAALAGGTSAFQLSIWEWDGKVAQPSLIRSYAASFETPEGVRLDGDLIRIGTKEAFKTFYSCGRCGEPVGEWTVRITGRGIDDLGVRHVVPELQLIDELYDQIFRGHSPRDKAAPKVLARLRRELQGADQYAMIFGWSIRRSGPATSLCLAVDNGAGTYRFTIVARGGGLYVKAVSRERTLCEQQ